MIPEGRTIFEVNQITGSSSHPIEQSWHSSRTQEFCCTERQSFTVEGHQSRRDFKGKLQER